MEFDGPFGFGRMVQVVAVRIADMRATLSWFQDFVGIDSPG